MRRFDGTPHLISPPAVPGAAHVTRAVLVASRLCPRRMAVASTKGAVPPFAELLRRSRFASYDPAIAQTYSAPPASARRGDYGLKRPIPMTYRDSYISVPTFEHHAHFTHWNNAERQVKFVRHMEELNVCARPFPLAGWYQSLGDAQHQWLIDSEFAPSGPPKGHSAAKAPVPPAHSGTAPGPPPVSKGNTDDLRSFGKRGQYQYGAHRPLAGPSAVQLNFESLSPSQFQRYLSQIRKLGPEFRAYLTEQYKSRRATRLAAATSEEARAKLVMELPERDLEELVNDKYLLFVAAQNPVLKLHRRFLSKHFSKNFANDTSSSSASSKIEAQPHRSGALSYCHPSDLQSLLTSPPLPGIIFQDNPQTSSHFRRLRKDHRTMRESTDALVLLGDFMAKLHNKYTKIHHPIYYPDTVAGVAQRDPLDSTAHSSPTTTAISSKLNMPREPQLFRVSHFYLKKLPKVVSYKNQYLRPEELLNETVTTAELVPGEPWAKRNHNNPHKPGSPLYIAHVDTRSNNAYSHSSVHYGSQMKASRRPEQLRAERQNLQRLVAHADEPMERSRMNEMSMGMDLKDTYSARKHAELTAMTLGNIVSGVRGKNEGDDGDEEL